MRILHYIPVLIMMLAPLRAVVAGECPDPPTENGEVAICGADAPEDIVVFQDRFLLVSSMSPAPHLYVIDTHDEQLAPAQTMLEAPEDGEYWGEDGCSVPASMVSHGLDLSLGAEGRQRLLVVNHGDRESIEFFEVKAGVDDAPVLQWRGCVMTPADAVFNDVAALPDGGFLATDPTGATWPRTRAIMAIMGFDTGSVYRWSAASGFREVPDTGGAYPNGITLAPDGKSFYLNVYFDGEVRQHDLASGAVLSRVDVEKPDNSNWSENGELLVASHRGSIPSLFEAIETPPGERNSIPFTIIAIDPASMQSRDVYVGDGTALGGGTAAEQVGDKLYIGAFRGDRMLRVSLRR